MFYLKHFEPSPILDSILSMTKSRVVDSCIKLTKSKLISEDNFYKKYINKKLNKINRLKINIFEQDINFLFDNEKNNEQIGGSINNYIINDYDDILNLYKMNKLVFNIFRFIFRNSSNQIK